MGTRIAKQCNIAVDKEQQRLHARISVLCQPAQLGNDAMGLCVHHTHVRRRPISFRDLSWWQCASRLVAKIQHLHAEGAGRSPARLIRGADGEIGRRQR